MELSEALKTIDATRGMFVHLLFEVQNGELKEELLNTPVQTSLETFYDPDKNELSTERREYYIYMSDGEERKAYTVDISPVCNYLINEWPSPTANRIRKVLNEVFHNSYDEWEKVLGYEIAPALEEGYDYDRFFVARGEHPRVLFDVLVDTFHEMIHALGLTDEELYGEGSEEETPVIPNKEPNKENEELINKLFIYFKNEETAKLFVEKVRALKKDTDIIELVKKFKDNKLCLNTSKDLWQVLFNANIYGKGYQNWNHMIGKK